MIIVGIDPGLKGAVVTLLEGGPARWPMPTIGTKKPVLDEGTLYGLIHDAKIDHVFLEQAHIMPKQGASSALTIGTNYGIIRGMLVASRIPHTIVYSQKWQAVMFAGTPKGPPKDRAEVICSRLWPDVDWRMSRVGEVSALQSEGLRDAALIAEYGRRVLVGGGAN